ncbi:hypothetical protein [Spiroplasma endosymbiont of Labia minor]|uniref:hypothetical protein n=1 Tax=Spiroplasma endosymbiont of Labia minor TaxID=3066305 RepID=UPI0030CCD2AD
MKVKLNKLQSADAKILWDYNSINNDSTYEKTIFKPCAICGREMKRFDFRTENKETGWDIWADNLKELTVTESHADYYELRHTYHMNYPSNKQT